MASWVEAFAVTVPAKTVTPSFVAPLHFTRPARIERVVFIIPDGPAGNVGFRLRYGGAVVIPFNPNAWIIGNNNQLEFVFWEHLDSGDWSVEAYNTGNLEHTLYFYFHVRDVLPEQGARSLIAGDVGIEVAELRG